MKKILSLCLVLLLLAGCGVQKSSEGGPVHSQNENSGAEKPGSGELTIYCPDDAYYDFMQGFVRFRSDYPDVNLQIVRFDTAEEMEERLVNELNTNTGPDAVVFDYKTSLDLARLAHSGAFLPLDEHLQKSETFSYEDYLPAAIEGCKVDDKQYFMPLSFIMMLNFCDASAATQGELSLEDFITTLAAHSDLHKDDDSLLSFYRGQQFTHELFPPLGSQLLAVADMDVQEIHPAAENYVQFRLLIDWLKTILEQDEKTYKILDGSTTTVQWDETLFISNSFFDIATLFSVCRSGWREGFGYGISCFAAPTMNDSQKTSVLAGAYAVITKDCKQPALATDLIQKLAEEYYCKTASEENKEWHSPVYIKNLKKNIDFFKASTTARYFGVVIEKLTDQDERFLLDLIDSIAAYHIPNPAINEFMLTEFSEYFSGNLDFDVAFKNFQQKISLYKEE